MESDSSLYFEDITKGDRLPELVKIPSSQQLVKFGCATYDYYPLHFDKEFAISHGLTDIIVHGPLKNSFLAQLVTDWIGEEGVIKKLNVQYRGMDIPNKKLIGSGTVSSKYVDNSENLVTVDRQIINESGVMTTNGCSLVALPSRLRDYSG